MTFADACNGAFELVGGVMNAINCVALYRHKQVRGVHWLSTTVFTLWGFWNLWYYPSLGQWLSFCGGLGIVSANVVWCLLALHYIRKEKNQCSPRPAFR